LISVLRRVALSLLILAGLVAPPTLAVASPSSEHRSDLIVLRGADSAEGIAKGNGATFYAGELFTGDIYRGNLRRGTAKKFIDAPDGRNALGMAFDRRHDLLFVAGGQTGQAYVYDTRSGKTVASYQLGSAGTSLINDVTVTRKGAWFTNSFQSVLYFVPLNKHGRPGTFQTLQLSGPAAALSGDFNLNGIRAAHHGRTLIVAHSAAGALYTVDPRSGASALLSLASVSRMWTASNCQAGSCGRYKTSNQISRIRLKKDLTAGVVVKVITSDLFQTPTTAARFGEVLAVVNAKFDTGFPPTADQYEVVLVRA